MTPSSCSQAGDLARRTLLRIGSAFVLGTMTTPAGSSQPQPPMIYVQLVLKETPDLSISSPPHLYGITTSPSSRLPLPTDPSSRVFPVQSQNVTAVSNTTELGSMSCVRSITLMKPTMEYSLRYVSETLGSLGCSRLLPPLPSQKSSSLTSTKVK